MKLSDYLDSADNALADADLPKPSALAILHTPADLACFEAILVRLQTVIDVAGFSATIQSLLGEIIRHDACVLSLNAHDLSKTGCTPKLLATSSASKLLKWMRRFNQGQLLPTLLSASPGTRVWQHKSVRTVKTQLTSIYRKYRVRSRTRLLAATRWSAGGACRACLSHSAPRLPDSRSHLSYDTGAPPLVHP